MIKIEKILVPTDFSEFSTYALNYAIAFARTHDYRGFYDREFAYRRECGYPPISRIIKIGINANEKHQAVEKSRQIIRLLKMRQKSFFTIVGPAPSPLIKLNNKYRWHILIKINPLQDPSGKYTRGELRKKLMTLLNASSDKEQIFIDVDPIDMM